MRRLLATSCARAPSGRLCACGGPARTPAGAVELVDDAEHLGVPITVWSRVIRDEAGAFFVTGHAPTVAATPWIERWRAHASSLAFRR